MKKDQRKRERFICIPFALLPVLLCMAFAAPGARAADSGLHCVKQAFAEDDPRTFRLEYRVWADASVKREAEPCDVVLLADCTDAVALQEIRAEAQQFLRELSEGSPGCRAAVVAFGREAASLEWKALSGPDLTALERRLEGLRADPAEKPDYTGALEKAAELAGKREKEEGRGLVLITLTSGLWTDSSTGTGSPLAALQPLREKGAKLYTVQLCGSPEEKTNEFWQSMASAPAADYALTGEKKLSICLRKIRRRLTSALTVEVRQQLDPRFEPAAGQWEQVWRAGGRVTEEDGSYSIFWEAEAPANAASPWTASLTIRARMDFPGGNDVPTDRQGTGLYFFGHQVEELPQTTVNVGMNLELQGISASLFLGESVWSALPGQDVEALMWRSPAFQWYGKGRTGSFTYHWETLSGRPIGSIKQLKELAPERDSGYRFRVTYRPASGGLFSAGTPVKEYSVSALYRVKVVPGTVRIIAVCDSPETAAGIQPLLFRLEGEDGSLRFSRALPKEGPESGSAVLRAEFAGLPFGRYSVFPMAKSTAVCQESNRECFLGVWAGDDTVSVERCLSYARFTLRGQAARDH